MSITHAAPDALHAGIGLGRQQVARALRDVDAIIAGVIAHRDTISAARGADGYTARLADWRRRRDALAAELAELSAGE